MSAVKQQIGFIGAGKIAQAIGQSILRKGLLPAKQVFVSAPTDANFNSWKELGVNLTHNNYKVLVQCEIIFLAMKPQFLDQALKKLHTQCLSGQLMSKLIISTVGGLTCETLHEKLKKWVFLNSPYRLIRIIPNTSLIVGEGFTAICPDVLLAREEDVEMIKLLMSAGGTCEVLPESLMSTVSALAGSGVAFVYQIIEALSDGAVKHGLPRAQSYKIAAQTLLGASKMILDTNQHPASLKDDVCSPGGTTICGIHALERGGLRAALMNAIEVTIARSKELNEQFKTK